MNKANFTIIHLRQRSHFPGEIPKRSFISPVRRTVHANPLRKRSFTKTLFKPPAFRFPRVDGKHFENEDFRKRWRVISLPEFS